MRSHVHVVHGIHMVHMIHVTVMVHVEIMCCMKVVSSGTGHLLELVSPAVHICPWDGQSHLTIYVGCCPSSGMGVVETRENYMTRCRIGMVRSMKRGSGRYKHTVMRARLLRKGHVVSSE